MAAVLHKIESNMLALLGTLLLAVLVNAQRPEPCGKFSISRYIYPGFGVYDIQ